MFLAIQFDRMRALFMRLKKRLVKAVRRRVVRVFERWAMYQIDSHPELARVLADYIKQTGSTGCSYIDYWTLYRLVRERKPKEVLELGTGVTTIVLGYAVMENTSEGFPGRVTSVEEHEQYYQSAVDILPSLLDNVVEIVHCHKQECTTLIYRGVCYEGLPDRPYDFVFVDGPTTTSPSGGEHLFDMDFIRIVAKSDRAVFGVVDCRKSSVYVFQQVFGKRRVRFDRLRSTGFVGPVSRKDIRSLSDIVDAELV